MNGVSSPVREAEPVRERTLPVSGLASAALATLAYHDLLDLPLTSVQVWRYLLRPKGAELKTEHWEPVTVTLRDVEGVLGILVAHARLQTRWGFYVLPGRDHLVDLWIEKHARSQAKWKRLRRIAWWLQAVPFLRGVAGTGSLAFDNAKPESDLDVLIIAAERRVWTVRFLLTILLDAFRLRRRPRGPTKDRVCLNHYLAADALTFPFRSLYTALEYARMVTLLGEETCLAFRGANRTWMIAYLVQVFPDTLRHGQTARESSVLHGVQRMGEALLRGRLGDRLEALLARFQRARIASVAVGSSVSARSSRDGRPDGRADVTTSPRGRVVATDTQAEFHPHSREAPLLAAFNARMNDLGLAEAFGAQQDSGLTL